MNGEEFLVGTNAHAGFICLADGIKHIHNFILKNKPVVLVYRSFFTLIGNNDEMLKIEGHAVIAARAFVLLLRYAATTVFRITGLFLIFNPGNVA